MTSTEWMVLAGLAVFVVLVVWLTPIRKPDQRDFKNGSSEYGPDYVGGSGAAGGDD